MSSNVKVFRKVCQTKNKSKFILYYLEDNFVVHITSHQMTVTVPESLVPLLDGVLVVLGVLDQPVHVRPGQAI